MPRKKPYEDGCAAAHAMDLVGERWSLLIVRELVLGPKRFSDLKRNLVGVSTNILAGRLSELEAVGVLVHHTLPSYGVQVYELTDWGRDLEPIIRDLGRWAARSPHLPQNKPMSAASLILSLRTMFAPERAANLRCEVGLWLDGLPHVVRVADGVLTAEQGESSQPELSIYGNASQVAGLIYGGQPVAEAVEQGLEVRGPRRLLASFRRLFPLPPTI